MIEDTRNLFRGLDKCIEATTIALRDADPGPDDPTDYEELKRRLELAVSLPRPYRKALVEPLQDLLTEIGPSGFARALLQRHADLALMDVAQAILQRAERYVELATAAFQEVVADLYDGFLSVQHRHGAELPDNDFPVPLVKWGRPQLGAYDFSRQQLKPLGFGCGIVNLPPGFQRPEGLFGWAVLAHETAGHGIVCADRGLLADLNKMFRDQSPPVRKEKANPLERVWPGVAEEAISDLMGVLNMGPGAVIGALVLACAEADLRKEKLEGVFHPEDPHPPAALRIVAMTHALTLCPFKDDKCWVSVIQEVIKPFAPQKISVDGDELSFEEASSQVHSIVETVLRSPISALGNVSLPNIQAWRDEDERRVDALRETLLTYADPRPRAQDGLAAAHVVSAAIIETLRTPADQAILFGRMLHLLRANHRENPSWGPLAVLHQGDLMPRGHSRGDEIPDPPIGSNEAMFRGEETGRGQAMLVREEFPDPRTGRGELIPDSPIA